MNVACSWAVRYGTFALRSDSETKEETVMAVIPVDPNPGPGPSPVPDLPPIDNPSPPVKEPDPDRLPDENPDPNPDENDEPAKQVLRNLPQSRET